MPDGVASRSRRAKWRRRRRDHGTRPLSDAHRMRSIGLRPHRPGHVIRRERVDAVRVRRLARTARRCAPIFGRTPGVPRHGAHRTAPPRRKRRCRPPRRWRKALLAGTGFVRGPTHGRLRGPCRQQGARTACCPAGVRQTLTRRPVPRGTHRRRSRCRSCRRASRTAHDGPARGVMTLDAPPAHRNGLHARRVGVPWQRVTPRSRACPTRDWGNIPRECRVNRH